MKTRLLLLFSALLLALTPITQADYYQYYQLEEMVIPQNALELGRLDYSEKVRGQLLFRLSNPEGLEALIARQHDPASPDYQRWLTPTEFAEQFAVSASEYENAARWLTSQGFKVDRRWTGRHALEFSGSAANVERVFGVEMHAYLQAGKRRYAAKGTPKVPLASVYGVKLDSLQLTHPILRPEQILPATSAGGRIAIGPEDLYLAYNISPLLRDGIDGTGQKIGIVARCDFELSDVASFRSTFGLPEGRVTKIAAGGPTANYGGVEETEVLLNAQLSGMVAPKAEVQVVIAEAGGEIDQSLAYFVNNLPETKVINISFGLCERELGQTFQSLFANLYKQGAAQGQSIFVAVGNGGANDCRDGSGRQVNGLASSPYVTAVGGTTLQLEYDSQGKPLRFLSETTWTGSGGGLSIVYDRPSYQQAMMLEGTTRAVPDLSLLADPGGPGYFIVRRGLVTTVGGTSAATPCWVGIFALANQLVEGRGFGLVNPRLYKLGQAQQQGGARAFRDITVGNNSVFGVVGFEAKPGYDLCTGWGSANADVLVREFPSPADSSLFLLFPNGGEFLNDNFTVRWRLSEELAAQATRQSLHLSTDGGKTFSTVADLDKNARSYDFNRANLIATSARFRIVVETATGSVVDTSDANFNIGSDLRIEFATYSESTKLLVLEGTGFGSNAKLTINGKKIKKAVKFNGTDQLSVKGKTKQLGLKTGANEIMLEVDTVRAAAFTLFL